MNDNWKLWKKRRAEASPIGDHNSTSTISRRAARRLTNRLIGPLEIVPLTEEELRALPIAHRYSS